MAQPVVSPEPRRTPLAPADVIDYLLERGALVAADLVHADFYVEVIERRNRTYVVHGTSPLVVVKTSRDLFDQGVEHEAATYRALQDGPEGLGACVPRVLSYDEERRALVLEYVRDAQSLHDYHLRSGRAPAYVGRAVGRLLGELHNAWSSSPAVTQPPWALSLAAPPMMILQTESSGTIQVLQQVQAMSAVMDLLEDMRLGWKSNTVNHGDVRLDNLLFRSSGRSTSHPLVLLDWELSEEGDGLWDVACFLAGYVEMWVTWGIMPSLKGGMPRRRSLRAYASLLTAHWFGYNEVRGAVDARDDSESPAVRVARLVGARLLQSAMEYSQGCNDATPQSLALLPVADSLLTRPAESWVHLLGLPLATGNDSFDRIG